MWWIAVIALSLAAVWAWVFMAVVAMHTHAEIQRKDNKRWMPENKSLFVLCFFCFWPLYVISDVIAVAWLACFHFLDGFWLEFKDWFSKAVFGEETLEQSTETPEGRPTRILADGRKVTEPAPVQTTSVNGPGTTNQPVNLSTRFLFVDDKLIDINHMWTLRWLANGEPVLYHDGSRVTQAWKLSVMYAQPADPQRNANTT
jgi:hypothetical protein